MLMYLPFFWEEIKKENTMEKESKRKPRILCLHGYRESAKILKKLIFRWPESVTGKLDLVFLDAPFPAKGKSRIEGYFDPPYFEWFQFNKAAILCAAIPGMQREGVALTKVPKIKFVILISGAKFGGPSFGVPKLAVNAFSYPINCPSLHFLGEKDYQKKDGEVLLECFVDPQVIHHPKGHAIPELDDSSGEIILGFIEKTFQKNLGTRAHQYNRKPRAKF
ncbi:esterase AGAP003155-like isoform X2 [Solanum pennellii]|uniref:Esterase AGAP003155-like isoform X2 n=1 Tax=Solanum pennellii TaxID=28526 RepID=A0ABM1UYV5_SOLPN|nr:esterase AGAP003155-like isoform X2 [Solanum pennellii]